MKEEESHHQDGRVGSSLDWRLRIASGTGPGRLVDGGGRTVGGSSEGLHYGDTLRLVTGDVPPWDWSLPLLNC